MDGFNLEIIRKFPLLNIDLGITGETVSHAGYTVIYWPDTRGNLVDFKKYIAAVTWCREYLPDVSHCASNMFWFVSKNDATLFSLTWL